MINMNKRIKEYPYSESRMLEAFPNGITLTPLDIKECMMAIGDDWSCALLLSHLEQVAATKWRLNPALIDTSGVLRPNILFDTMIDAMNYHSDIINEYCPAGFALEDVIQKVITND
jgi:hypothetical protein